jgi:hypothetical protein
VKPIPWAFVEPVLSAASPPVGAMIELQWLIDRVKLSVACEWLPCESKS